MLESVVDYCCSCFAASWIVFVRSFEPLTNSLDLLPSIRVMIDHSLHHPPEYWHFCPSLSLL